MTYTKKCAAALTNLKISQSGPLIIKDIETPLTNVLESKEHTTIMNTFPSEVKQKLNSIIKEMSDHHWLFTRNPNRDFSRQHLGKLSFYDTMRLIIGMGKGSTADEVNDFFDMDCDKIPSLSAFNQRRSQITLSAFQYLFSEFSSSFRDTTHRFKDHCILAFDGCHVVYSTNETYLEDYNKPRLIDYRGYNHMHLNGFVDVISKAFLDIQIQPGQQPDERKAMNDMLEHFSPDDPTQYIITADRGYESYDLIFQCLLKKLNFVFRVKSPHSSRSLLSSYISDLPEEQEEYDVTVKRFFSDKLTNLMKQQPDVYHYMNPYKNIPHFYKLLNDQHLVYLQFRALKIKTAPNTYEYIITNLPHSFDWNDIKEIYHWRWGIEVAFRFLKHSNGLLHFHCKKPEFLKQEIYANLILYNFGIFVANEAARVNRQKSKNPNNKYAYEVDVSNALKQSRKFYLRAEDRKPTDLIRLLQKYVHAVKESYRHFERHLHGISAIRFGYR